MYTYIKQLYRIAILIVGKCMYVYEYMYVCMYVC